MNTARQIIASELIQWMEKADFQKFGQTQRMEEAIGIWEYGKWCAKGSFNRLGVKPQIKFRGSRPESSGWDAIADISDDEGMRIHAATIGLDAFQLDILERIYELWEPPYFAIKEMKTSASTFYRERSKALHLLSQKLQEK